MCRNNFKIKAEKTGIYLFLFSILVNANADENIHENEKNTEAIEDRQGPEKIKSKLSEIYKKDMELLVTKELDKLDHDKKDKKRKKSKKEKKEKKSKQDKKGKRDKKEKMISKRSRRSLSSNSRTLKSFSRSRSRSIDKSKNKLKFR